MKCRTFLSACIAAAAILASSCSEQNVADRSPDNPPVPETKGVIGVTCMDMANPFFKLIADVMEAEARQYGYEILARSADQDPAKQNTQLADFVAQEKGAGTQLSSVICGRLRRRWIGGGRGRCGESSV